MKASSFSLKSNGVLIVILTIVSLGIIALSNIFGTIVNLAVIGIVFFISFFFVSYRYPRYNILILLACNYILSLFIKIFNLYEVPFGIVNEALCAAMLLTLMLNGKISGIKTLPGILLMLWLSYQVIELANPYTYARITGFYSIRSLPNLYRVLFYNVLVR